MRSSVRSRITRPGVALAVAAMGLVLSAPAAAGSAASTSATSHGPYRFDAPSAIAVSGHHLWIANLGGDSVTETTLSGAWVRTVKGGRYGFHQPDALAQSGDRLLVVNRTGSVTELDATTGALIRLVHGPRFGFHRPGAIVARGATAWVTNQSGDSVTEFDVASGALIRVVRNHSGATRFDDPVALTSAGAGIWVVNSAGGSSTDPAQGSLTEIRAADGVVLRQPHAAHLGLERPAGIAFDGRRLWVSDSATDAVTELSGTGRLVRVITNQSGNQNYGFDGPNVVVTGGGHVYVNSPLSDSPMVTQINPGTADGDWFECNTNSPTPGWLNPTGLAVQGGHVWVVGAAVGGGNVLVELDASASGPHAGQVIHRFTG